MTASDWEILIAIVGTAIAIFGVFLQGSTPRPALRTLTVVCIVISGVFTLRALSLKRAQIAEERRRATELELRLERAGRTVESLGNRLQAALDENSKLLANMDSMRHDLTAMRTVSIGGVLPPQYVGSQMLDGKWHGNSIRVKIGFYEQGNQKHILDFSQASNAFAPGPLRGRPRTASIVLLNVRPADMSSPTFKLMSGDLTSPRTFGEFWNGRKKVVATRSFAHGDTVVIAPAEGKLAQFWLSLESVPELFIARNPDAAIQITVQ